MPQMALRPIGGARTVYQYADALAASGHEVEVVHPRVSILKSVRYELDVDPDRELRGGARNDSDLANVEESFESRGDNPHPWYQSHPGVRNVIVPNLSEEWFEHPFDITIVNNQRTVSLVQQYSPRMGRKVYFLQDYESYMMGDSAARDKARRTLLIDWPIICTSLAGVQLIESIAGRSCHLVRNAINTDLFRPILPIDSDKRTLIGFPARSEGTKRTYDAIGAAELIQTKIPSQFSFWCFGYDRIPALPNWITQYVAPDDAQLAELYNRSRIFLVPSKYEGFGRPGAEAMACGAALISTKNGGAETYALNDETALLCNPGDPQEMAAAISFLLKDEDRRRRIAENGARNIASWKMSDAIRKFEQILVNLL